jgi:hypothetical protein
MARREWVAGDPLDAKIAVRVKWEVAHQLAAADLGPAVAGDLFRVNRPLWYMKGDISAAFEAVEEVYRNHANRRTPKNRPDRYPKGDPQR